VRDIMRVTGSGNLTREVELRATKSGAEVATLRVAFNTRRPQRPRRPGRQAPSAINITPALAQTVRHRSQKHPLTWERMDRLAQQWLPLPRILHPGRSSDSPPSPKAGTQRGPARWDLREGPRRCGTSSGPD